MRPILTIAHKADTAFLAKRTREVDLAAFDPKLLRTLIKEMREIMRAAVGAGLSANQIGLDMRLFVAEVPDARSGGTKFYAIVNPELSAISTDIDELEEGCLSVPGKFGTTPRARRVTLTGFDINGKRLKIKAQGFLAQVFQHEVDHLNGLLFTSKATKLYNINEAERLRTKGRANDSGKTK